MDQWFLRQGTKDDPRPSSVRSTRTLLIVSCSTCQSGGAWLTISFTVVRQAP